MLLAARAYAIPAFSRKTGMGCPVCHDGWPRLNDFGELYRDLGYRLGNVDDDVFDHPLDYFPISFRTTVGYEFTSTTHQATDAGDRTINTGAFVFPQADIYFGMALANHVSVYVDIAGFGKEATASLESAWVRFNDLGTNWLNLKVGILEMDLPVSMHRSFTIFSPFLIYGFHPTASVNGFTMGENQTGLEVMGHANEPGLRYSVVFSSSSDVGSDALLSAPVIYGHVTYTQLIRSDWVPRVRGGIFGDIGWWPTSFQTLTPMGGMPAPVPGTGTDHQEHGRIGGDVQVTFAMLARPLTLSGVWMYGQEEAGLIAAGTRDAQFHGGFAQLDYTPIIPLTFGARYDAVFNIQQADPTQPENSNNQTGFSVFGRYAVWLSAWGSVVADLEVSTVNTENAAAIPTNPVRRTLVFAGLDMLL
jgi:hypothetical protein